MRPVDLLRGKWIVLAAGLAVSCFLNPQPEPPGETSGPGKGGSPNAGAGGNAYNVTTGGAKGSSTDEHPGVGGWYGIGGAASTGTGVSWSGGTSVNSSTGGSTAAVDAGSDAGFDELDAGSEPDVSDDLAQ